MTAFVVDVWEVVPCDHCGAAAGDPCVTRDGVEARRSHACRIVEVDR